jgi:hypothetical protein
LVAALLAAIPAVAAPLGSEGCDFNGDGRDDLAVGVPGKKIGSAGDAGAVRVVYGGGAGLRVPGNQLWHEAKLIFGNGPQSGDRLGEAVACGDFDHDGFSDLAVGVPGQEVGPRVDAGSVQVIFGASGGLGGRQQQFTQNYTGIEDAAEDFDRFGSALAVGDFDADGFDDLAVGVPSETFGSASDPDPKSEGLVNVIYGTATGLSAAGNKAWTQGSPGVLGMLEPRDLFGSALTAGDFDGDGYDDLAIGVPGEAVGTPPLEDAGAVNVLFGAWPSGLDAAGNALIAQGEGGVDGVTGAGNQFGAALASGDFDGNGRDDLAVGAPGTEVAGNRRAGAVNVLYGESAGLSTSHDDLWTQDSPDIEGQAEPNDHFGAALAVGDFNATGRDDLAIGAPWDSNLGEPGVGAVHVLYGVAGGLFQNANQRWHQDSTGIAESDDPYDWFGEALSAGDYDGDGRDDLTVAAPGEDVAGDTDGGSLNVIYGGVGHLVADGSQLFHQETEGLEGDGQLGDRMGGRLRSTGLYRMGFPNGALVTVAGDHASHRPPDRVDLTSSNSDKIVAAQAGTVRAVVEGNAEPTNNNNYVWIEHANGEWTKYTHFQQNSVLVTVGQVVSAAQKLGTEGDVGAADGVHLHFEVAVPDNPATPITNDGTGSIIGYTLDPMICGIPGQTFVTGESYAAADC